LGQLLFILLLFIYLDVDSFFSFKFIYVRPFPNMVTSHTKKSKFTKKNICQNFLYLTVFWLFDNILGWLFLTGMKKYENRFSQSPLILYVVYAFGLFLLDMVHLFWPLVLYCFVFVLRFLSPSLFVPSKISFL